MRASSGLVLVVFAAASLTGGIAGSARAADSVMKTCGTEWKAAKAANQTNGQTWLQYLDDCRKRHAGDATATPAAATATTTAAAAAPAATTAAAAAPAHTGGSPRVKACAADWKAKKAANEVPAGQTWPKFEHECVEKMKADGK